MKKDSQKTEVLSELDKLETATTKQVSNSIIAQVVKAILGKVDE